MMQEIDYNLLVNVIDGNATPEEMTLVETWLSASEENRELYFRVKDILDQQKADTLNIDPAAAWEDVTRQLKERTRVKRMKWLKYAAMVAVLILAGGLITYFNSGRPATPEMQLVQTTTLQSKILPDGTKVWLKAGGTLSYRSSFGKGDRDIWVTGTAFFDVAKEETPFNIHAANMEIAVLGTSFTIHEKAIIVNSGKVKTTAQGQEMLVLPNERVQITTAGLQKDKVNAQIYGAWKDGDYQFDNTTIDELKDMINSNYGLEVTVITPSAFEGSAISGYMKIADEASLVKILSAMLNASIIRKGDILTIQPK
ncbi:FecR domain-containing protein [Chitinophaga niabensis]|uniref:FecR domain-containing protein n=1 Tax=Chitinophaga niabensis TaxID=536979 RepID=UPI0031BA5A84